MRKKGWVSALMIAVLCLCLTSCASKKAKDGGLSSYAVVSRTTGESTLLKGYVRGYNGQVVGIAKIEALGRGQSGTTETNEQGYFELRVASGQLQLDVSNLDYGTIRTKPLDIRPKEVVELNLVLGLEPEQVYESKNNKSLDKAGEKVGYFTNLLIRIAHFFKHGELDI